MKNIKITKSDRKSIGIYIMRDASVEVRCPKYVTNKFIEEFIESKKDWIEENVEKKRILLSQRNSFTLKSGCDMYFMGKIVPLKISHVHYIDDTGFYISGKDLRLSCETLYKRYARDILTKKTYFFAKKMNCPSISVKINSAKTRWGSCSGKNSINYSWKLILADERAVDYVVIHELAHTFEHNHSAAFWKIVEQYLPDYKARRELLNEAQKIISYQDW